MDSPVLELMNSGLPPGAGDRLDEPRWLQDVCRRFGIPLSAGKRPRADLAARAPQRPPPARDARQRRRAADAARARVPERDPRARAGAPAALPHRRRPLRDGAHPAGARLERPHGRIRRTLCAPAPDLPADAPQVLSVMRPRVLRRNARPETDLVRRAHLRQPRARPAVPRPIEAEGAPWSIRNYI